MTAGQEIDESTPEEGLIHNEKKRRLRTAIRRLPPRERKLVEGYYFEDRPFQEVAAELGVSKSWASRLHTRALLLLRSEMADSGEEKPTDAGPELSPK